jgi:hypothetical protein
MTTPPPSGIRKMSRLLAALDNPGMPVDQPESSLAAGMKRALDLSPGRASLPMKRQATAMSIRTVSQIPATVGFGSGESSTFVLT